MAALPAGGPLEFLTLTGLAAPGATARFRIYAITRAGQERGSDIISLTRPP